MNCQIHLGLVGNSFQQDNSLEPIIGSKYRMIVTLWSFRVNVVVEYCTLEKRTYTRTSACVPQEYAARIWNGDTGNRTKMEVIDQ